VHAAGVLAGGEETGQVREPVAVDLHPPLTLPSDDGRIVERSGLV
jgi:hypothetical protein